MNISFTKNVNLIIDFNLLKIQQNYEQYYNHDRNRLLREELNYNIDN